MTDLSIPSFLDRRATKAAPAKKAPKPKVARKRPAPAKKAAKAPTKAKATKKAAPAKKAPRQTGTKAMVIRMLSRKNGASLAELQKEHPLKGKTPLATYSALITRLKADHKIERIGDGKGADRRMRIK